MTTAPRIALGSFMLESNAHSPVATREEFAQNVLIAPSDLLADLRQRTQGLTGSAILAAAAAFFQLITDVILNQTTWSSTVRGALQGITGVLGGLYLARFEPSIGLGLGITGIVDTISGGIADYRTQSFFRSVGLGDEPASPPASGVHAAGALPPGYRMCTLASCNTGVPVR